MKFFFLLLLLLYGTTKWNKPSIQESLVMLGDDGNKPIEQVLVDVLGHDTTTFDAAFLDPLLFVNSVQLICFWKRRFVLRNASLARTRMQPSRFFSHS